MSDISDLDSDTERPSKGPAARTRPQPISKLPGRSTVRDGESASRNNNEEIPVRTSPVPGGYVSQQKRFEDLLKSSEDEDEEEEEKPARPTQSASRPRPQTRPRSRQEVQAAASDQSASEKSDSHQTQSDSDSDNDPPQTAWVPLRRGVSLQRQASPADKPQSIQRSKTVTGSAVLPQQAWNTPPPSKPNGEPLANDSTDNLAEILDDSPRASEDTQSPVSSRRQAPVNEMSISLRSMEAVNDGSVPKIVELEESLTAKEMELDRLREELAEKDGKLHELEIAHELARSEASSLKSNNANELDDANERVTLLEAELAELRSKTASEVASRQQETAELQSELRTSQDAAEERSALLQAKDMELELLRDEQACKDKEIEDLKANLMVATSSARDADEVTSKELARARADAEAHQDTIRVLEEKIVESNTKIEDSQMEITELQDELERALDERKREAQQYEQEILKTKADLATAKETLEMTSGSASSVANDLQSAREALASKEDELTRSQEQLQQVLDEHTALKKAHESALADKSQYEGRVVELETALVDVTNRESTLVQEMLSSKDNEAILAEQHEQAMQKERTVQAKLEAEVSQAKELVQRTLASAKVAEDSIAKLQVQLMNANNEIKAQENEIAALKRKVGREEATSSSNDSAAEAEMLTTMLCESKMELAEAQETITSLRNQLRKLKSDGG